MLHYSKQITASPALPLGFIPDWIQSLTTSWMVLPRLQEGNESDKDYSNSTDCKQRQAQAVVIIIFHIICIDGILD
jgi:hypothetical protein